MKRIIGSLPPKSTYATASTGVAACHIGGTTLHSFAGLMDLLSSIQTVNIWILLSNISKNMNIEMIYPLQVLGLGQGLWSTVWSWLRDLVFYRTGSVADISSLMKYPWWMPSFLTSWRLLLGNVFILIINCTAHNIIVQFIFQLGVKNSVQYSAHSISWSLSLQQNDKVVLFLIYCIFLGQQLIVNVPPCVVSTLLNFFVFYSPYPNFFETCWQLRF